MDSLHETNTKVQQIMHRKAKTLVITELRDGCSSVAKGSGKHSQSNSTNNICGPPAPLIFHAQSQNSLCISPCSLPRFHSYKQLKVRLRTCTIMQFFATSLPFASLRDFFESHNMQRNVLCTVRLAGFCRLCYYDKLSFK